MPPQRASDTPVTDVTQELDDLVHQLVALHGEGGVCPTAEDWRAILRGQADAPVTVLNLLKFTSVVQTPEGASSGASAYRRYSAMVSAAFARVGGKLIYFGKVGHGFAFAAPSPLVEGWDAAILTRYPSPRALAAFWLDPEFVAAHAHRIDGVERSQAFVLSSMQP